MNFEFATATRIIFGAGTLNQIGASAKSLGQRALVVTGRDPKRPSFFQNDSKLSERLKRLQCIKPVVFGHRLETAKCGC